jgi:ADP-ribosyl-[dinitrogen reductase] hydrolase
MAVALLAVSAAWSGRVVNGSCRRRFCRLAAQPPLETFAVKIPELGAAEILITPCPGKRRRDLGLDLDQVRDHGCSAVLTLVQDHELEMLDVVDMGARVAERGMAWLHCPIPDFGPPGNAFESAWVVAGAQARGILSGGGKLVCHCRGGIGRAGTIASRLLIELGVATPEDALRRVRKARPGAVETWEQESHVLGITPLR